jgi:hypothetical protein
MLRHLGSDRHLAGIGHDVLPLSVWRFIPVDDAIVATKDGVTGLDAVATPLGVVIGLHTGKHEAPLADLVSW